MLCTVHSPWSGYAVYLCSTEHTRCGYKLSLWPTVDQCPAEAFHEQTRGQSLRESSMSDLLLPGKADCAEGEGTAGYLWQYWRTE